MPPRITTATPRNLQGFNLTWRQLTTTYSVSPLNEQEEQARQAFKTAFIADYDIKSESDLIILDLASYEYAKAQRLQTDELTNGRILGNIRFHPINELVRLLSLMDASRAAKLRSNKPVNENEQAALDFFMSISEIPTTPGTNHVTNGR